MKDLEERVACLEKLLGDIGFLFTGRKSDDLEVSTVGISVCDENGILRIAARANGGTPSFTILSDTRVIHISFHSHALHFRYFDQEGKTETGSSFPLTRASQTSWGRQFIKLFEAVGNRNKLSLCMEQSGMSKRTVTVEGGGENLYEISESGGQYYTYKVSVSLLWSNRTSIGSGRSLKDALTLIEVHSGRRIKSVD